MNGTDKSDTQPSDVQRVVEELVPLLFALTQRLQQHASGRAAELGLSQAQAKVLAALQPGETIPMRTLAARLDYDAANLTGLIDKLEAIGAVERRPDPRDRRIRGLVLTEAGQQLREEFRRRLFDYGCSFGELSPADLEQLRDLVRRALTPARPSHRPPPDERSEQS